MKQSKALLEKANILPKLRLVVRKQGGGVEGTGAHKVRIITDHIVKGIDSQTGKEIPKVKYIFEENGDQKEYSVAVHDKNGELHYLVQRLAEIPEGNEVILEYKRAGIKGYIEVIHVSQIESFEIDEEENK